MRFLFNKKRAKHSNPPSFELTYRIKYNTNAPTKTYEVTDDENTFINELLIQSKFSNIDPYRYTFTRLSNGTISVAYDYLHDGGFVGKFKLCGKKHFTMYMKDLYDSETIYGELDECIDSIPHWIQYINGYLK